MSILLRIPDEEKRIHALVAVVHEELDERRAVRGILRVLTRDPERTFYRLLAGEGPLGSLPRGIKRRIAKMLWTCDYGYSDYCLSMFLSKHLYP